MTRDCMLIPRMMSPRRLLLSRDRARRFNRADCGETGEGFWPLVVLLTLIRQPSAATFSHKGRDVITRMPHRRHTLHQIGWGNQRH
jgi:hypothetical protein